jgi:hypothetical protein
VFMASTLDHQYRNKSMSLHLARTPASLRRNPIRDSIRVAKGKARPNFNGPRAYTFCRCHQARTHPGIKFALRSAGRDPDAAEPPHVPRVSSHTRKRSNTGPRQSAGAFRSLANHAAFTSNHSLNTAPSGETCSNIFRRHRSP